MVSIILRSGQMRLISIVSRYGSGRYEHVFETTTAGVTIQSPQLDINTVASGGGSRLFFRNGLFVVGPESAGAHPGPGCYRKGGYPFFYQCSKAVDATWTTATSVLWE